MQRSIAVLFALAVIGTAAFADEPKQAPFLWSVKHEGTTHYLMGSVHMLPARAYPLPAELNAAYDSTRGLVLEADLEALASPAAQGRLLGAARDMRKGGIKASIGDKLYKKLQAHAEALGAPGPMCDGFQAWFCALTLEVFTLQRAGFDPAFGIDHHFYSRAREEGRPVRGLETAEEQTGLFIGMPEEQSVGMLAATLDELTDASQDPEEMFRIWRDSDMAAVMQLTGKMQKKYPKFHARLLSDRNRAWGPRLQGILGGEVPQLVIVGAAHLPGPDGLLAMLAEAGFKSTPVTSSTVKAAPAVFDEDEGEPADPEELEADEAAVESEAAAE